MNLLRAIPSSSRSYKYQEAKMRYYFWCNCLRANIRESNSEFLQLLGPTTFKNLISFWVWSGMAAWNVLLFFKYLNMRPKKAACAVKKHWGYFFSDFCYVFKSAHCRLVFVLCFWLQMKGKRCLVRCWATTCRTLALIAQVPGNLLEGRNAILPKDTHSFGLLMMMLERTN